MRAPSEWISSKGLAAALSERGSALPTALAAMVVLGIFSMVSITGAATTQRGTTQDSDRKGALAVADAGSQVALYRYNKVATTEALPCVTVGTSGELVATAAGADGWCAETTGSVKGGTYSYVAHREADDVENLIKRRIVVTSTVGGENRRLLVTASAPTGTSPFNGYGVQSVNQLTLDGTGRIDGSAASNADIVLNGEAVMCGDAAPGPGQSLVRNGSAQHCAGYSSTPADKKFNAVPADQGNAPTVNDNDRFFAEDPKTGNVSWNPDARELALGGSGTVTLGGSIYSLCKLTMSGSSSLIIAAGASVQIFFDSPENCGQGSGVEQLSMTGGSKVDNTNGTASSVQFFFLGSPTETTKVKLAGDSAIDQHLAIYAPRSEVSLSGNATLTGAITGKQVSIVGEASVAYDGSLNDVQISVVPLYTRDGYVECRGTAADGTPDGNC